MATTSQSTTEVECPLCGKYRGEPSSVEAHISRKTDEAHKGETGNQHREELQPSGGPSTEESTTSSSSESSGSESSGSESSSEPERGAGLALAGPVEETAADDTDDEATPVPEPSKSTAPAEPVESDDESDDGDDEGDSTGKPVPVDESDESDEDGSLWTVALVVFGGVVAFRLLVGGGQSTQPMQGPPRV